MDDEQPRTAAAWPSDVLATLGQFKQGDLFDNPVFFYWGAIADGLPWEAPASEGEEGNVPTPVSREFEVLDFEPSNEVYGIITTQTCDLCEEGIPAQPCFQASPVHRLSDEFADRTVPAYLVRLDPPDLPPGVWVADLRIEVPIEKTFLVGRHPLAAFPDEDGYLKFAATLGRRRDRAALGAGIIDAVAKTLRQQARNNRRFRKVLNEEIQSVRLNIDRGTRLQPVEARVHVVARGPISEQTKERFEAWWDKARIEAEAAGIHLFPNEYHDSTCMDVEQYERLIDLGVTQ
jgi:hypothetical protein